MKNTELRIGNYVQHNDEIIKVEQITKRKIGYHKNGDKSCMHYLKYSEIKPIEITDKMLLDNGFKYVGEHSFDLRRCFLRYGEECIIIYCTPNYTDYRMTIRKGNIEFSEIPCLYIQELQNAYYMAYNKELELKF